MQQLAINCKFFYVSIVSTNSSKCRFFTVFEVQLILMYYFCVSCVFSVYFIFRFQGSYECCALTFLSSFYLMLLSTCQFCFVQINMDGRMDRWMDGWMEDTSNIVTYAYEIIPAADAWSDTAQLSQAAGNYPTRIAMHQMHQSNSAKQSPTRMGLPYQKAATRRLLSPLFQFQTPLQNSFGSGRSVCAAYCSC